MVGEAIKPVPDWPKQDDELQEGECPDCVGLGWTPYDQTFEDWCICWECRGTGKAKADGDG